MRKKELAILVSSALLVLGGSEAIAEAGTSRADSWGFSCESAIESARSEACHTCYVHQSGCGETVQSSCDDGWIYDTAQVAVECTS
jgi:hypothetical protein